MCVFMVARREDFFFCRLHGLPWQPGTPGAHWIDMHARLYFVRARYSARYPGAGGV